MTRSTPPPPLLTHAKGFAMGAIAACGAVTLSNPFEVVKTRLQLQGELVQSTKGPIVYPNAWSALLSIAHREGLAGIQRGLIPAYAYQILMNGTRLGLYEPVKTIYANLLLSNPSSELHHSSPTTFILAILAGASTGILGTLISNPLFLIKTRTQSYTPPISGLPAVGTQYAYTQKGILHSAKVIVQAHGWRGLWKGVDAACLRTGIGSAVQLASYDSIKSELAKWPAFVNPSSSQALGSGGGFPLHFSASLLTSFFVVVFMNPFDVAMTRMYNQPYDPNNRGLLYKNGWDCLVKTVRAEGPLALYKGFTAHYMRIGPHTVLTFVFLEQVKRLASVANWT